MVDCLILCALSALFGYIVGIMHAQRIEAIRRLQITDAIKAARLSGDTPAEKETETQAEKDSKK